MSPCLKSPLTAIMALAVLLNLCFLSSIKAGDNDNLQNEIESINLQLDYLKLKVSDSHKKTRKLENRIKDKKTEISELQLQIEQLGNRQTETLEQINRLEQDTLTSKKNIQSLLERYRARLVQLHKIRQGTLLSSVFSARDLNSFLNRYHMVKYLLKSDKELIHELKKQNMLQRKLTAELQSKQQLLETDKIELDKKRKKLDNENSALKGMLTTILLEKKLFLEKEKSLESARNELETEISKTEDSRKSVNFENELTVIRKEKTPSQPPSLPNSASDAAKIMQFAWPVLEKDRKSVEQTGTESSTALQIAVNNEAEIIAAAKGKILYKGTIGGLGNVIILGHQRGFSSVYARLDDIWVGLSQIVEKGETIGKISAGRNRALHFEIRFAGKKQKPLNYLPE